MSRSDDPLQEWLTRPGGIAGRLRAARLHAGLTGTELAERNGWQQSKVSKIETGRQVPTSADVEVWLRTCGAEREVDELLNSLEHLTAQHYYWRLRLRQGLAAIQTDHNEVVRDAAVCREFNVSTVPGLLQTADYARDRMGRGAGFHGASVDDLDAAVAARMKRQEYLYDTSRRFDLLLAEPVLRWLVPPPSVMLAQLDRLLAVLSGMPNIHIGILPMGAPISLSPQNSFFIADDVAYVETFMGETVHYGDEAAAYHRVMDRLWQDAVTGEQARALILRAVEAVRKAARDDPPGRGSGNL